MPQGSYVRCILKHSSTGYDEYLMFSLFTHCPQDHVSLQLSPPRHSWDLESADCQVDTEKPTATPKVLSSLFFSCERHYQGYKDTLWNRKKHKNQLRPCRCEKGIGTETGDRKVGRKWGVVNTTTKTHIVNYWVVWNWLSRTQNRRRSRRWCQCWKIHEIHHAATNTYTQNIPRRFVYK